MRTELDPELLSDAILHLYKLREGELISAAVHIGDRTGLLDALVEHGPVTSDELASHTGLHERWVREWLFAIAASELAFHDNGKFALTPEMAVILGDEGHPASMVGVFGPPISHEEIDRTVEAFRTGIGMTWDQHGEHTCHFQAAMGAAGQKAFLVPVILASIEGMTDRLSAGATVVDIGCGAGVAAAAIAEACPSSRVIGIDPSAHAIASATQRARDAGLDNLEFREGTFDDLDDLSDVDLLLTLDVIHDLPRPGAAVRSARSCLADDGVWMVADIRARNGLEENREYPLVSLLYGMSLFYCMSSAMSEPGGAGLGTLGLTVDVFEELLTAGGFSSVDTREFKIDPLNRYYEVRV